MSDRPELPEGIDWVVDHRLSANVSRPKSKCPHCGKYEYYAVYKRALIFSDTYFWSCNRCGYSQHPDES